MTKLLQKIFSAKEPSFSFALRKLEQKSGSRSLDIKYSSSIIERGVNYIRSLGLDPRDSTAEEIYKAACLAESPAGNQDIAFSINSDLVSLNKDDLTNNKQKPFKRQSTLGLRLATYRGLVAAYAENMEVSEIKKILEEAGISEEVETEITQPTKKTEVTASKENQDQEVFILCVGDIISDDFIELDQNFIQEFTDKDGYKRISLELGAKIPYVSKERVYAVECAPNAAVSISRLGIRAGLMTWIGDDRVGRAMVDRLQSESVLVEDIVVEEGKGSNFHYVLRFGSDRTKLQKFEDYSYKWHDPVEKPDWIYLGVLGENTWQLHQDMLKYLLENPEVKFAFQPGMYHLIWGSKKLKDFYKRADIVILNREEAAEVTGLERVDIGKLIAGMHDLGVKVAVITDGPDGAYASDGKSILFMENYPDPKKPLDRTGAGDAFASTIVSAIALGEPLEHALEWAPINSMSVVQKMGAQAGLLTRPELKKYLAKAPKSYKPVKFDL